MSDLLKVGRVIRMEWKLSTILAIVVVGLLFAAPTAYAQEEEDSALEGLGTAVLGIVEFVFGPAYSADELSEGDQAAYDELNIENSNDFAKALFLWILPAVLLYAILYDFVYLMGFFRKTTAMIISAIFAIFAAKLGVFIRVVVLVSSFMGGVKSTGIFIPMLTITLIMMVIWWALGHVIWGYKFTAEIQTQTSAIDYLDKIGTHLEKKVQNK